MKAFIYLRKCSSVALALLLFSFAFSVNRKLIKPYIVIAKQDETWNLNDEMIKKFNLGFRRLESSFLWISTILESDIDHYKKKDLNSWMFRRFNSISILEPLFYENYSFGGMYLSIIKDDLTGASLLYNRGLNYYKNDFNLLRDAGFHFYFEVEDYKRAYEIYSKLKNHPKASPIIISSLARLEKSQGNSEEAFTVLLNKFMQLQDKQSFLAQKIQTYLYSLKAEIDLKCLNSKDVNMKLCSTKDFQDNDYLKKNGSYQAILPWEPFKIKKKTQYTKF